MKSVKILIPVLLILVAGCSVFKNRSQENIRTGVISLKELKHYRWFKKEYKNYNFSKIAVDSLSGLVNFRVTIAGGEWCSDTKLYLPRFVKILESVKFPEENLKIIFVDRTKHKPEGFDNSFDSLQIKLIPTFIVFDKSGNEIGRIVEAPTKTLEGDLLKIINQQ